MNIEKIIQNYQQAINNINQLYDLLKEKLIELDAINSDGSIDDNQNPSFDDLIHRVSKEYINTYDNDIPMTLPVCPPIDTKENISLTYFNILFARKILYYCDYLVYQLLTMGVDAESVNEATTLQQLILLLDKIVVLQPTYITWENDTLYTIENSLDIQIFESKTQERIFDGKISIFENGFLKSTYDMSENITLSINNCGSHTYTIKFHGNDAYATSTLTKTFYVQPYLKYTSYLYDATMIEDDIILDFKTLPEIRNKSFINKISLNANGDLEKEYDFYIYADVGIGQCDDSIDGIGQIYLNNDDDIEYKK